MSVIALVTKRFNTSADTIQEALPTEDNVSFLKAEYRTGGKGFLLMKKNWRSGLIKTAFRSPEGIQYYQNCLTGVLSGWTVIFFSLKAVNIIKLEVSQLGVNSDWKITFVI